MKKSRFLIMLMAFMLVGVMAFAFVGCGETETAEEPAEEVTSENVGIESLLEDPEYDINVILTNAGLWETLDATGVDYEVNENSNTTSEIALDTGDEELDGVVGTFMAYAKGDTEYEVFPNYQIAGEKDGVVYILLLPTDVRYNAEDPQQSADYEKLMEAVKAFSID